MESELLCGVIHFSHPEGAEGCVAGGKKEKEGTPKRRKEKPVEALQRAVANYSHCFTVFSFIMDTDLGDSLDEGSSTNTTGMVGDVSAG